MNETDSITTWTFDKDAKQRNNSVLQPSFKQLFPNVVIVIDCTELEMEKPSALNSQSTCYSSYKSRTTMKVLVGITPSGVLSFISELFPGSTSDQEIVKQSNFLNILSPGDSVMADKGFNIRDELASICLLYTSPSPRDA